MASRKATVTGLGILVLSTCPGVGIAGPAFASSTGTAPTSVAVTAANGTPSKAAEDASITVEATVRANPATGHPGTAVRVTGAGFLPGESVNVLYTIFGKPSAALCLPVKVASDGTFSCAGSIPSGQRAGWDGRHNIIATGETSKITAKGAFTLTGGVDQPTLSVGPTLLRGRQPVHASGTRWADRVLDLLQCGYAPAAGCKLIGDVQVRNGDWSLSYGAIEGLLVASDEGPTLCGVVGGSGCYVKVTQGPLTLTAPLTFATVNVTISPSENSYQTGSSVTVDAKNFPSDDHVEIEMCGQSTLTCGDDATGLTNDAGGVSFQNYSLVCVDFDPSGDCYILASDQSYGGGDLAASISFSTYP